MKNLLFLVLFANISQFAFSHGGEDHGEKKVEKMQGEKSYFTVNSISDVFEAVLRYNPVEAGHGTNMTLFVSDFTTNKPVDSAKIEITCPDDNKLKFTITQIDKGTYSVGVIFPENKKYNLVANISAKENTDLMPLEGVEVGKKIMQGNEAHTEVFLFSWKMMLAFLAGIILSALLFYVLTLKKKVTIQQ